MGVYSQIVPKSGAEYAKLKNCCVIRPLVVQ